MPIVFSTNPDYQFEEHSAEEPQTLPPSKQKLLVMIDRKNRGGKQVTLVKGFQGSPSDLEILAKTLKTKCGVGGSVKDGEVILQGDFRDKLLTILTTLGYAAKRGN